MSAHDADHGWWWTTNAKYQSAAYLRAHAAGAQAAEDGRSLDDCPYREHGVVEERRLLAYWNWGWSRVALFGESPQVVGLDSPTVLPSSSPPECGGIMHQANTTPLARWGLPDSVGRFLVRVIDYEHYEFAEDLSGVGNMLLAAIHRAVEQLHPEVDYRTVGGYFQFDGSSHANPLVARLLDGTLLAASAHEGYSLSPRQEVRAPTVWELAAWSGLPVPPPPPPPPAAPVDLLLKRLGDLAGEEFQTKRGVRFTHAQHHATLWIRRADDRGGNISYWELRRALAEWPAPGPSALSIPAATRGYVWALLADERVLGLGRSEGDLVDEHDRLSEQSAVGEQIEVDGDH